MSNIEEQVRRFVTKYEVNPKYGSVLHRLADYHTVIVADDSASMQSLADPDDPNNPGVTRWQELKTALKIILEAHHALSTTVDIYFANRGHLANVSSLDEIERQLRAPPTGPSNLLQALHQVEREWMTEDRLADKGLILHILTDGHPTKPDAKEDVPSFADWLRHRPHASRVCVSLVLCTDDASTEHVYRLLETASSSSPSISRRFRHRLLSSRVHSSDEEATLSTSEVSARVGREYSPTDNVDVTLDYRGEILQVWRTHGRHFPFNYGDYVVKLLIGSIDQRVHEADLSRGNRLSDIALDDLPPHPLAGGAHTADHDRASSPQRCVIM